MAQYATLKAAIDAVIKANGQREITGTVLNQTLNAMVNSLGANYQFAGLATPSTNPGTPDQNVFYLAFEAGTYTNFNATVLSAGISILMWNGSWSSQTFYTIDATPTASSNNLISSGAVFDAIKTDGSAYDVSAHFPTGGPNSDGKFTLEYILSNANTLIPAAWRKGGMSIRFVSSSDNKYVQYHYMVTSTAVADFTNVANWQKIDGASVIELTAITGVVADNGVTKAGDMYYNINTQNLRMCKTYNTSPTDSTYETIAKRTYAIYKCGDKQYGFDSDGELFLYDNNPFVRANKGVSIIKELYLIGLDPSKEYEWFTFKRTDSSDTGVLIERGDISHIALASFTDETFSNGIVRINQQNGSGIYGYIIKDFSNLLTREIEYNYRQTINTSVVSNIDWSPAIKSYYLKYDLEAGNVTTKNATNAINAQSAVTSEKAQKDVDGKTLIGVPYGTGVIEEIYISPFVGCTPEQLASVNNIAFYLGSGDYYNYGCALKNGNTVIKNAYVATLNNSDVIDKGVVYCNGIAIAFNKSLITSSSVTLNIGVTDYMRNINNCPKIKDYFGSSIEAIDLTGKIESGYYIKTNGGKQASANFGYTKPLYLHAGDTIEVSTQSSTNVAVINRYNRGTDTLEMLVQGTVTTLNNYSYTAITDTEIVVSLRTSNDYLVAVRHKNEVVLVPDLTWLNHQYISADGTWQYYTANFGITKPVEVFKGDVLSITATGGTTTSLISKSREDGYTIYGFYGGDNCLVPLIVPTDNSEHLYTYTIEEHCYVVLCINTSNIVGDAYPKLYIKRKTFCEDSIAVIDDWNRTHYTEQKHFWVDECNFIPNAAKKRGNSILTYVGDTKQDSNYIANAVAYPNGEIIACRQGGAVVKILNNGTEVPIQLNGADMVITNASDWRGVFIDSHNNVFISPHSSTGGGDDGQMSRLLRGIYKIPYNSLEATKVYSLYYSPTDAPVRPVTWAANTAYTVGQFIWYVSRVYKCTEAHTSTSEFDTTKFAYLDVWAANTAYVVGSMARVGTHDFECIVAHTSESAFNGSEQNNWIPAGLCVQRAGDGAGPYDTIWTFCEDNNGNLYAGIYAHTIRRFPVILKSADGGLNWRYIFNFATDMDYDIPASWDIVHGPRHIHGITFNEYDNCLYCACGEVNSVYKSSDGGLHWEDLKCGCWYGKPTSVIGVPDGLIMGSDGQWECGLTKICTDGTSAKLVGQIWASFIFYIRRSDLTGYLYAFSRLDNVIASKGNGHDCPPVEAMTNPVVLEEWKESVNGFQLANWQVHHDFCEKYYPDDAIIPHHAAIMVSRDNGDTWEILRYEDVGTNGSSGFFTIGYFRDGECLCGLISDDGRETGNIYVKPIIISEGKKKRTSDGKYDLTGEIFIKLNESTMVNT